MSREMQIKTIKDFDKNEQNLIRAAVPEMISLIHAEQKRNTTYQFNKRTGRLEFGKVVNIHAYSPAQLAIHALFGPLAKMDITVGNFSRLFNYMAQAVEYEAARELGYVPAEHSL
jgi:hypothetical protein